MAFDWKHFGEVRVLLGGLASAEGTVVWVQFHSQHGSKERLCNEPFLKDAAGAAWLPA